MGAPRLRARDSVVTSPLVRPCPPEQRGPQHSLQDRNQDKRLRLDANRAATAASATRSRRGQSTNLWIITLLGG